MNTLNFELIVHVCSVGCAQWMVHWGCVHACVGWTLCGWWMWGLLGVAMQSLLQLVWLSLFVEVYNALECTTTTYVMTASYSRLGNCGVFNDQCLLHVCIVISHMLLVHKECDNYIAPNVMLYLLLQLLQLLVLASVRCHHWQVLGQDL